MAAQFEVESCVRGYHIYKAVWTPTIGEVLSCTRETVNLHDHYAVKVERSGVIVGHLPKKISTICSLFISNGGTISCQIDGSRRYSQDLDQGGLEIPCLLKLEGDECLMIKVKKLLEFSLAWKATNDLAVTQPEKKIKLEEGVEDVTNDLAVTQPEKKIKLEEGVQDVTNDLAVTQPEKKIKLEEGVEDVNDESVWLTFNKINLSMQDKTTIQEGSWLSDMHINFAQSLLKLQFKNVEGLQDTVYQNKFKFDSTKKIIQILHISGNHWIVISNIRCGNEKMHIYDSLYTGIGEQAKELILSIFDYRALSLSMFPEVQKQEGSNDCGVFAIATATSILFGLPIKFTQSLLRPHLVNCFEKLSLQPFT